jgi:hypothetical protein
MKRLSEIMEKGQNETVWDFEMGREGDQ